MAGGEGEGDSSGEQFRCLRTGPGQLVPLHPRMVPPQSPEEGLQVSSTLRGAGTVPMLPQTSYSTPARRQGRDQLATRQFAK